MLPLPDEAPDGAPGRIGAGALHVLTAGRRSSSPTVTSAVGDAQEVTTPIIRLAIQTTSWSAPRTADVASCAGRCGFFRSSGPS